jgi:hypothetical protein
MIAATGFKFVRMDLFWKLTEKTKGQYNFNDYEGLMSSLTTNNMFAYFILDHAGNPLYTESNSITTDAARKAYGEWAAAAVDHFKGRGIIWEIWNEPNVKLFWNGKPDVAQYRAMALEAVKAIRKKTKNEIIVGPATSIDLIFLEECFKVGLLNYWDAVSVHPYRASNPETVFSEYLNLKNLIKKYAPNGKSIPIISGEWGYYDTVWKNFNTTAQAKYLPRELLTNVMNNIPVSAWYDWHDDGTNASDPEHHFGIVLNQYNPNANPVYTPKDSYFSAKALNSFLNGFRFVKRIATNDPYDYVLLFSNGNELRVAAWTTIILMQSHQITIPSDNCNFDVYEYKGNYRNTVSAKDGSLTITVYDSPTYLFVKGPNLALQNAQQNLFQIVIIPVHGKELLIRIYNLNGNSVSGTVNLINYNGIRPKYSRIDFQFGNEIEKVINIPLNSIPENNFTVGIKIQTPGNIQSFLPQKFYFLPKQVINDCYIWTEGDPNVQSEQSVSVSSAPQPLYDSDLSVLKIDYHFYGQGWKYLNVNPITAQNRLISGQPKAFGIWIYGDSQDISIRMRIDDSTQLLQIGPVSEDTIYWNGWRYIQFYFNIYGVGYGDGANVGIQFPIQYHALLLLDNQIQANIKSTVYISSPVIMY